MSNEAGEGCDCVSQVNKSFERRGESWIVETAICFGDDSAVEYIPIPLVNRVVPGKTYRAKKFSMVALYCPFCGKRNKVAVSEKSKEVTA